MDNENAIEKRSINNKKKNSGVPVSLIKTICRLRSETRQGTGVLVKIPNSNEGYDYYCLTADHVLPDNSDPSRHKISIEVDQVHYKFEVDLSEDLSNIQRFQDLDVCLIKLPVSFVRTNKELNFYEIPKHNEKLELTRMAKLFIIHHGSQMAMQISNGEIVEINGLVIRHNVETQLGSSGAPVFDERCNLVGVHLGGYKGTNTNVAISMHCILERLEADSAQISSLRGKIPVYFRLSNPDLYYLRKFAGHLCKSTLHISFQTLES